MLNRKLSLFLAAIVLGLYAVPAQAQSTGTCDPSIGEAYLDINNVRARVPNNGNLFYRGEPHVYNIPKGGPANAIFASGIWLGGTVGGQLRLAGSTYGPYEFWAGPLDDNGAPPANCAPYDRVFKVSKEDVVAYDGSGAATPDLQDWPTGLGAPTLDANGDPIDLTGEPLASRIDRKINLGAGERPLILGDQMLWWIMNDRGNTHSRTGSPAMGVEVHVSAFAFNTAGAIGNTTFYKYRIFYKGSVTLDHAYFGIYSDPDLGNFQDDYVGSDTTLGLGFVYNADNDDEGGEGYGIPPAAGYDFFQGPLVNDDGIDNDRDGEVDEDGERLKMTAFAFYTNGAGACCGDPNTGEDMYNYMQGRWKDGQRFTLGGSGRDFSNIPTSFQFPGNPPEFWSEFNADGAGTAIAPADRRFVMASGPFTIRPGDEQEIVFGIVTSFGSSNLDSVRKMKADDLLAQAVFDIDFALPSPPAAPRVKTTPGDNKVLIEWGYNPTDNNYLDSYRVIDPLLSSDVTDNDYEFEGYTVYRYSSRADQEGQIIAVYDKVNGIKRVIEGTEVTFITAEGTDSGVLHFHEVGGLTNYQTYYFGVQAYAYNAASGQKVYPGPISRFSVVPSRLDVVVSEDAVRLAGSAIQNINAGTGSLEATNGASNIGNGNVSANVTNPAAATGLGYDVKFFSVELTGAASKRAVDPNEIDAPVGTAAKGASAATVTSYDIVRSDGVKVFDGAAATAQTGKATPQGIDVVQVDGLSFNIQGPAPSFLDFTVVANASGPLASPAGAGADWRGFPGQGRPGLNGVQQQVNGSGWLIHAGGGTGPYDQFLARWARNGLDIVGAYDYEIRFDGTYRGFNNWGCGDWVDVPFSIWNAGIGTPNDPSDDRQYVPLILPEVGDDCTFKLQPIDHPVSGGSNDPYTDWFYWYDTANGYAAAVDGDLSDLTDEIFGRTVLVNFNGGDVSDGTLDAVAVHMPEPGTIFRISTSKPNQPGDSFSIATDGLGARARTNEEQVAALDNIGITPNPYKGASAYEVSQLVDEVRFTNMPVEATIRVFTLNGTLVTTLVKNSTAKSFAWDLTTSEGLPIASGMYIIHIDVPNLGERVLKFGVVKKRVQLNNY